MGEYIIANNREKFLQTGAILDALPDGHLLSLDFEATGLAPRKDHIVGMGLSWAEGEAAYLPSWHIDQEEFGFTFEEVGEMCRKLKRFRIICHKWTYDAAMAYADWGVALPCWDDTYLLAKLTCEPMGLKDAMVQVFGLAEQTILDIMELMKHHFGVAFKSKGHTTRELPLDGQYGVGPYCCADADYARRYYYYLKPKLKPMGLVSLHKIEVNTLPIARKLTLTGVPVNASQMREAIGQVRTYNDDLEKQIYKLAGGDFKINSPVECPKILFDKLELPVILRSKKTGARSTSKEVMEQLEGMHPIVELISEWRESTRMTKSYLEKIPDQLDDKNRIYSEFNPLGAVSGRWTSSSMEMANGDNFGTNLQNQSKKRYEWIRPDGTKATASVRMAFEAPKGWVWARYDYNQIEPRVGASLSGEPYLLENFKKGIDSHTTTASVMFGLNPEEVLIDTRNGGNLRKKGKITNLALGYGMGVDKLGRQLHSSQEEAQMYLDRYWENLPLLATAVQATKDKLIRTNKITTFFGRTRIINVGYLKHKDRMEYDSALRKAWNTTIQGTAADLLKIGMLRVASAIKPFGKDVEMVLTVHDELDFLIREEILFDALRTIRRAFEIPTPPNWASIIGSVSYGPNWDETSQQDFDERDAEPFQGWGKVLPEELEGHIEEEFLVAA